MRRQLYRHCLLRPIGLCACGHSTRLDCLPVPGSRSVGRKAGKRERNERITEKLSGVLGRREGGKAGRREGGKAGRRHPKKPLNFILLALARFSPQ